MFSRGSFIWVNAAIHRGKPRSSVKTWVWAALQSTQWFGPGFGREVTALLWHQCARHSAWANSSSTCDGALKAQWKQYQAGGDSSSESLLLVKLRLRNKRLPRRRQATLKKGLLPPSCQQPIPAHMAHLCCTAPQVLVYADACIPQGGVLSPPLKQCGHKERFSSSILLIHRFLYNAAIHQPTT